MSVIQTSMHWIPSNVNGIVVSIFYKAHMDVSYADIQKTIQGMDVWTSDIGWSSILYRLHDVFVSVVQTSIHCVSGRPRWASHIQTSIHRMILSIFALRTFNLIDNEK